MHPTGRTDESFAPAVGLAKGDLVRSNRVIIVALGLVLGALPLSADAADGVVAPGAKVEKLAGDFKFTEGPTCDADGNVYFTDQPNDRILKWSVDGKLSTFMQPAGRANGMCFDAKGNLLACADEKNELWSIAPDGKETVVLEPVRRQGAERAQRRVGAARRRAVLHRPVLQAPVVDVRRDAAGRPARVLPVRRRQEAGARRVRPAAAQRHHRHAGRQDAVRGRHPRQEDLPVRHPGRRQPRQQDASPPRQAPTG